jgi:hypothetical protein
MIGSDLSQARAHPKSLRFDVYFSCVALTSNLPALSNELTSGNLGVGSEKTIARMLLTAGTGHPGASFRRCVAYVGMRQTENLERWVRLPSQRLAGKESNLHLAVLETAALPIKLPAKMHPPAGFEPAPTGRKPVVLATTLGGQLEK